MTVDRSAALTVRRTTARGVLASCTRPTAYGGTVPRLANGPRSLAGRRLPQLDFVAFRIDDPGELPVLGVVDLLENVAAFLAQNFDQGVEILYAVCLLYTSDAAD